MTQKVSQFSIKRVALALLPFLVAAVVFVNRASITDHLPPSIQKMMHPERKTVDDRVAEFGAGVRARIKPDFDKASVSFPPDRVVLLAIKKTDKMELYAASATAPLKYIRSYDIQAASGSLGPKLTEGDCQVPEGVYAIESLNPNSSFHLSLRVGYPNAFDRARAADDGRTNLGGDIMVHGASVSVGCLAMGDQVAEDLFILAADIGRENVNIIIAPVDFRRGEHVAPEALAKMPPWTPTLYAKIKEAMAELTKP
ncbi:MAG TPA: hypothetical protein VGK19_24055 [Capsulimonadaceae bacterium]|jgi:hypothetical protein